MRPRDVLKVELIGLDIEVVDSHNPHLKGLRGKIIDETRNTLTIEHNSATKCLIKDQITFVTLINNRKVMINGALLVARPEERLKKKVKR